MREKSDNRRRKKERPGGIIDEVMRVELPSMGSQTCAQRRNHVQIYVTGVTFMLEACSRKNGFYEFLQYLLRYFSRKSYFEQSFKKVFIVFNACTEWRHTSLITVEVICISKLKVMSDKYFSGTWTKGILRNDRCHSACCTSPACNNPFFIWRFSKRLISHSSLYSVFRDAE